MAWHNSLAFLLLFAAQQGCAQRGDQSICDYYAAKKYGENNAASQLKLMQSIVAYAYAGGNSLPNGDRKSTGIFNPGQYDGRDVYLRPWFDGSMSTSNNNDQPVSISWLDGGGTAPLVAFLNGSSPTVNIKKGTNQFKLFTHWYYVFGKTYSCSLAKTFLNTTFEPLNPAYVHKYMDLNRTHVGYFIDQLIVASKYFGFSVSDANSLSTSMNAKYNARCLPPIEDKLNSICLSNECDLATSPNCDAYTNIKPRGVDTTAVPSSSSSSNPSSSSASSSKATTDDSSSSHLSGGAIAGIVIGAAVLLLLAVGICMFFRRRNRKSTEEPPSVPAPTPAGHHPPPPHYAYGTSAHESYYSRNPTDSFISSHVNSMSPGWVEAKQRPEELGVPTPVSPHPATSPSLFRPEMSQLAEMESPEPPAGWNRQSQPARSTT